MGSCVCVCVCSATLTWFTWSTEHIKFDDDAAQISLSVCLLHPPPNGKHDNCSHYLYNPTATAARHFPPHLFMSVSYFKPYQFTYFSYLPHARLLWLIFFSDNSCYCYQDQGRRRMLLFFVEMMMRGCLIKFGIIPSCIAQTHFIVKINQKRNEMRSLWVRNCV